MVSNRQVLAMLDELVELTTLDDGSPQSFKVRAYERARRAVENLGREVAALGGKEIEGIAGIGRSIAASIVEFSETGRVAKLEGLRSKYPPAFRELTRIPGLGPKTVKMIRRELGVESLDDLLAALADHRLRDLPGLGEVSEAKIARAVERLGLAGKDRRIPLVIALPIAETLRRGILGELEGVEAVEICGSARRFRESVADLDLVVAADPERRSKVMDAVSGHPLVEETLLSGSHQDFGADPGRAGSGCTGGFPLATGGGDAVFHRFQGTQRAAPATGDGTEPASQRVRPLRRGRRSSGGIGHRG